MKGDNIMSGSDGRKYLPPKTGKQMLIAIILHFINYWDIAQSVERSAVEC